MPDRASIERAVLAMSRNVQEFLVRRALRLVGPVDERERLPAMAVNALRSA
ncbi:MAG: hypothetical protein IT459_16960 [Planctomycetes bacterium]|nr:hypothetical protein [Planctomycetota bacterium]